MGKLKGQASPDFAMSAMIFSTAILFVFFHISRTYYTRTWEVSHLEKSARAQNLILFLTSENGNWSVNPFESEAIAFGEGEINETQLQYFFGMPYQTVQHKLNFPHEFKIEIWKLPSIGITSDVSDFYINETVKINFKTNENCSFYIVMVGTQGSTGVSYWNTSIGKYHGFNFELQSGVYSLQAIATTIDGKYGAYESTFRVVQ